ncbi:MAG: trigger factor [Chloroflexota bacterium]|nr:trigger factor [Chloroflexota bacterium]
MKITTEPLENCQLALTIEVDEERAQQAMRRAARQIARQVNVPGFRKGKAPYGVIVQRHGEDAVRQEAADLLAQEVYREALEQEGIEPYAPGVLDEVLLHPVTFRFTIPLRPTVDLGEYRDYRLKISKAKVSKKEVQQALETVREQNAVLEPVDRPSALNDVVVVDVEGQTAEGVVFLKGDDTRILLDAESSDPAPGFAEAIVGMEAGEERTFTLTLPDTFPREELQGQEAEFTVRLVEVYERTLPELDDDLARTVGNLDSFKELRYHVREQLQQAAQEKADKEYARQVLGAVIEQSQVEYPPVILEEELDAVVEDFEREVVSKARLSLEDYLRIQGETMEELREELKPQAVARLTRAIALGEVVRLEGLEVGEEELDAHIEEVSAAWGARADDVRTSLASGKSRRAMRSRLLADAAVQRLVAIAKGEAEETRGQVKGETGSGMQEAESEEAASDGDGEQENERAEGQDAGSGRQE